MSAKRKILIDEQQNQARCADGVKMNKTKLKQEFVTASPIKKQLESCCSNSVRKKIQNQWVDALDYIKTIKTKNDRGIGYHESKQNEFSLNFFTSFIV